MFGCSGKAASKTNPCGPVASVPGWVIRLQAQCLVKHLRPQSAVLDVAVSAFTSIGLSIHQVIMGITFSCQSKWVTLLIHKKKSHYCHFPQLCWWHVFHQCGSKALWEVPLSLEILCNFPPLLLRTEGGKLLRDSATWQSAPCSSTHLWTTWS